MHRRMRVRAASALGASVVLLSACGGNASDGGGQALPTQEKSAVDAAFAAAQEAAGGKEIGGTVSMLGVLSGPQLDAYLGTFKPFEDATGIDIEYEGTRDLGAVLQTRIEGGNPPDLVSNPSAAQMRQLAADGELLSLDDVVDSDAVQNFPEGLLDLATVDGQLYGLFFNSAVNNLIWYDPKTYEGPNPAESLTELDEFAQSLAAEGTTPYCMGVESGAASGWPGAALIEQLLVTRSGPEAFDRWVTGDLPWTSPEVTDAFEAFGAIATDPEMVAGGPTAVLTTSFDTSPQGLVAEPPACQLHVQADFLGNLLASSVPGVEPEKDIDFFQFPPAEAGGDPAVITSGEMIGAFNDTEQTRALLKYVASPEFGAMVAGTGQWIGANQQTTLDAYTTPLSKKAAQLYADATTVRYTAQNAMPPELNQAFMKAVLGYIENPDHLSDLLEEADAVRQQAYGGS